jgi:hypothetical protein
MKMIKSFRIFYLCLAIGMVSMLLSCNKKDDDSDPVKLPQAAYDYELNGLEVTFTNSSSDADSYIWNFGDGSATVTDESPVYTYTDYGTYTVTLIASSKAGSDTIAQEIILVKPMPLIDGNFADWADIDPIVSYADGEGGTLTECKLVSDATYLYVYLKGTKDFLGYMDIYINTDNDTATGQDSWIYADLAADRLLEGDIAYNDSLDLFIDNFTNPAWEWILEVKKGSGRVESGKIVANGDVKETEFKIMYSAIPNVSTEGIRIGFCDYSKHNQDPIDWAYYGYMPKQGDSLIEYKF